MGILDIYNTMNTRCCPCGRLIINHRNDVTYTHKNWVERLSNCCTSPALSVCFHSRQFAVINHDWNLKRINGCYACALHSFSIYWAHFCTKPSFNSRVKASVANVAILNVTLLHPRGRIIFHKCDLWLGMSSVLCIWYRFEDYSVIIILFHDKNKN